MSDIEPRLPCPYYTTVNESRLFCIYHIGHPESVPHHALVDSQHGLSWEHSGDRFPDSASLEIDPEKSAYLGPNGKYFKCLVAALVTQPCNDCGRPGVSLQGQFCPKCGRGIRPVVPKARWNFYQAVVAMRVRFPEREWKWCKDVVRQLQVKYAGMPAPPSYAMVAILQKIDENPQMSAGDAFKLFLETQPHNGEVPA